MIGCVWYNVTPLLNIYRNVCVVMYSHNWSKKRTCSMPVHKEGNELCIIYTLICGSFHGHESLLQVRACYLYSPRNQTTSCQNKPSKILVQRIIEVHSMLPSQNRNKTLLPAFYRRMKYPYSFGCIIKALMLAHSCFNSHAPELVPIFYSAIKHGTVFYFLINNRSLTKQLGVLIN